MNSITPIITLSMAIRTKMKKGTPDAVENAVQSVGIDKISKEYFMRYLIIKCQVINLKHQLVEITKALKVIQFNIYGPVHTCCQPEKIDLT